MWEGAQGGPSCRRRVQKTRQEKRWQVYMDTRLDSTMRRREKLNSLRAVEKRSTHRRGSPRHLHVTPQHRSSLHAHHLGTLATITGQLLQRMQP